MKQAQSIHINFTGGIVSPGYLKMILETAAACGVEYARLGLRQQLILEIPAKHFASFEQYCAGKKIHFFNSMQAPPNIVSSYPGANIFTTAGWLKEGVFKDIFDGLDFTPRLKVNICDSGQCFTPFFTGHINWLSSAQVHYWQLHIRFPGTQNIFCWPELIYTNEVAETSKHIEDLLLSSDALFPANEQQNGKKLFRQFKELYKYTGKKAAEPAPGVPGFHLPYYEGFNRMENNYWLGIYRRDELFPVSFLEEVCDICLETKIGQLYTTPWKTLIIKDIEPAGRHLWDHVLGKYRINVRHAANELNWQVEDGSEDGLILKRHIIRFFDKEDVRTYGLCFAVQTQSSPSMFGSVIIRRQRTRNPHRLKSLERFDILHNPGFNPNASELVLFREGVEKEHIGTYLVSLCKLFYEQESQAGILRRHISRQAVLNNAMAATPRMLHQCRLCYTVYDERLGDADNNIEPNTLFDSLPQTFCCPLCGTDKKDFIEVAENDLAARL